MTFKTAMGYAFFPALLIGFCIWPPSVLILWPIFALLIHMCSAFSHG